ncbi:probable helicase MAGATAMA 3 [Dendrobium catenatum]|nr:probable helicase MAGATAMA 3 [Dendrobium catenatum]
MHPEISIFPSKEFYAGSLEDGDLLRNSTRRLWHKHRCFGPFCFFDIDGAESQPSGTGSWVNEDEIEFIVLMYHKLASQYLTLKSSSQLAIISPYRYQVKLLHEKFRTTFGEKYNQSVDINTVDGFQGREKDIAIFSCVRSNGESRIGFVSDFRRMNVGITRARSSVLVVGSASTLMQDDHWKNLVNNSKERNCYFKVSKPYASFFNDTNMEALKVQSKMEKKILELNEFVGQTELITDHIELGNEGIGNDGMDADDGGFDED